MTHSKNFLLYGGGLDSTALAVLLHAEGKKLTLVHIDYGQKAVRGERQSALYFASKYGFSLGLLKADMGYSESHIMKGAPLAINSETNRLELRNPLLITLAASYAASVFPDSAANRLYLGFHYEPPEACFPDARIEYLGSLERALRLACNTPTELRAPVHTLTRTELISKAVALDPEVLTHSYTCYQETVCGKCTHCLQLEEIKKELSQDVTQ